MVKIITDSTADFTREEAAGLGLGVVHLRTRFGDEEYIDGVDITPHQFYEKLVESDVLPTTSQPSPAEFEAAFASALEEAGEVVAITISSALSGTYQSAVIAAEAFGGRVRVVDSLSASIGEQVIVRRAAQLAAEGLSAAELAGRIEAERGDVCVLALLDTLEYLKRGGRISAAGGLCRRGAGDKARHHAARRRGGDGGQGPRLQKRRQPAQPVRGKARHRFLPPLPAGLHGPFGRAADEVCGGQR